MTDKANPLIKDLSRLLTERVSSQVGDVCQLVETDEEKLAVLLVALTAFFEAAMAVTADVVPTYAKLDRKMRCVAMNSILAQGILTLEEIRSPITDPRLPQAMNDITVALMKTAR
jgi:hypothetical protein